MPIARTATCIDPREWEDAAASGPPDGEDGCLHLWHVDLDHPDGEDPQAWTALDPAELARARRFRFPRDAARYRVAHLRLRELLGRVLDRPAASVAFVTGPAGRPALADTARALSFNLSHSGAHGLIGWSRAGEVGVDIECPRASSDLMDIARMHYDADEARQVALGGDAAFFACWTRKEAVLKACGLGLGADLRDVHVGADPAEVPEVVVRDGAGLPASWSLHAGAGPAGTVVAAAVIARDVARCCWRGTWSSHRP